jgi:hypothetical protein
MLTAAARYFALREVWRDRASDLRRVPEALRQTLLSHVAKSGIADNLARLKRAFG